ncbi:MAG: hypothetical protein ABSE49_18160 [Polyangiaceae bacterium]
MKPPLGLRDAEVDEPRDAVRADHDVVRRHVPVHQVERLAPLVARLVRGVKAAQRVDHDGRRDADGHALASLLRGAGELPQRFAVHVLHDEQEIGVGLQDVECGHDVGVPDARGEARLVEEHERKVVVARQMWVRSLDRDGAREAGRPEQACEVHRRHTTRGDLRMNHVASYGLRRGGEHAASENLSTEDGPEWIEGRDRIGHPARRGRSIRRRRRA